MKDIEFLKKYSSYAKAMANFTGAETDLYNDDGIPRCVVVDWPCKGKFICTVETSR